MLLGVTGSGKTFTMAKVIEATQRPALILAPEQDARRPALWRVQELLPRQRGRVFRLLLRLLPAGGLRPAHRHLHREGILDQRADRPHAPLGDARAARARRRHHRRLGLVHLRHRLGRDLHGDDRSRSTVGERIDQRAADRRPGRAAVPAQRRRLRSAAPSACAATRSRCSRPISRTAPGASTLFGDEVESIREFDPLTGAEDRPTWTTSRSTPTRTTSRRGRRCSRRQGHQGGAEAAAGRAARRRPAAGGAAAGAAHARSTSR